MTGDQLQALGLVVTILASIVGVILGALNASRSADDARKKERQQDIDREVKRVQDDLDAMTKDRDYWRTRANQFEDRAQGRGAP